MSKTFLVKFDDDGDSVEVDFDTPLRFRGSRENDTHYTVVGEVPQLFKEVEYAIYYGGTWTKIIQMNSLKKDIKAQFIVNIVGTDVPGDFEVTSDLLLDIIECNMHGQVAISVRPFGE